MQPILKFTTEKDSCFLILTKSALANTENLLRQRNYAEGVGKSWVPLAGTPFSGSFFTCALSQVMRAADLYFPTTAPQCGSGSRSLCLQPVSEQSREDSQRHGCFPVSWLPDGSCVRAGKRTVQLVRHIQALKHVYVLCGTVPPFWQDPHPSVMVVQGVQQDC